MLDYDDFNSQHSNSSMRILFEETCRYFDYPTDYGDKLCQSFNNSFMRIPGAEGNSETPNNKIAGTLMSGHRATTFVNSMLNAAYIRLACSPQMYDASGAIHVGDDVYMAVPGFDEGERLLSSLHSFGCRLNVSKQSIGFQSGEFLRMSITDRCAYGYLNRGIASCVSGNWVNTRRLEPGELVSTMIQQVWTLTNRGRTAAYAKVLSYAVSDVTRLDRRLCERILAGTISYNGGPTRPVNGMVDRCTVASIFEQDDTAGVAEKWPKYATTDYLTHVVGDIEVRAMNMTQRSVLPAMLDSSYKKALTSGSQTRRVKFTSRIDKPFIPLGSEDACELLIKAPERGVLTRYPILNFLRPQLTTAQVTELVRMTGVRVDRDNIMVQAWGADAHPTVIVGVASYADASSLSKRARTDCIYFSYPIYM